MKFRCATCGTKFNRWLDHENHDCEWFTKPKTSVWGMVGAGLLGAVWAVLLALSI